MSKTYRVEAVRGDRTEVLCAGVSWADAYRHCKSATLARRDGRWEWDTVRIAEETGGAA